MIFLFFFFKQKTAYEIGTGDWSSDVCSSDLGGDDSEVFAEDVVLDEALEEDAGDAEVLEVGHADRKSVV